MLSVYGPQSLRFLDRPWNRQRALKATTVQFNFVSFDDLVPYLPRFRQTFPNVENFEFIETDIRSLNQLNALALVQGITSLNVNPEGNPISVKGILSRLLAESKDVGDDYVEMFQGLSDGAPTQSIG